ncbi:MAG: UDP-4-amino-4,6-dideoxy-N-acetyl-beta-L-altrosamine transaminase [Desulfurivibrionaceae bacterium]
MTEKFLPYSRQQIEEDDIAEVVRVLRGDWLTTGPEVKRFEDDLATYCGAKYAVACANGTAALHLAVLVLGVKKGDGVITTPITFLSTANCARFVGADVFFADVEPSTINLDPEQVESILLKKQGEIKALLPVHFAGQPARMERFSSLAQQYGAKIIEDGCHALGAAYTDNNGETVRVGSCKHSDMTVFSFHPAKGVTTGEGGAITTNDRTLYEKLLRLRNHGMVRDDGPGAFVNHQYAYDETGVSRQWYYEMQELGYNYRITDFQCALGRSQLAKVERFICQKAGLTGVYRKLIGESAILSQVIAPSLVFEGIRHAHHLFVVRVDFRGLGLSRAVLMESLRKEGIGSQVHYIPLHFQPYYREQTEMTIGAFPCAEAYYEECLSLPLFSGMTANDVERVVATLEKACDEGKR